MSEAVHKAEAKGKPAKPEEFVDMTFIRELDQSGFIDEMYARYGVK